MSSIFAIHHAVEFIEEHLSQRITIADVADAVSYSLYHFCRMFNQVTHHSPYDYLMRRKLSESARELVETDKKITDIAFDYQFNSPETYSRAFKRMFDMQPNQWKKQGSVDNRLLMSRLTLAHIQHRNRTDFLKPSFEELDAFQVAGVVSLVRDDPEVVSQLWDLLSQESKDATTRKNNSKPRAYYGIVTRPLGWEERSFFYMAATELDPLHTPSPTLVTKTIPASKYVRFVHKDPHQDLGLSLDYIYHTWLPKSGWSLSYPFEIEFRGENVGNLSPRTIYVPIQ